MGYSHRIAYVKADVACRQKVIAELSVLSRGVPKGWMVLLSERSLTITSADRRRILKIDACKIYTLDVRRPDGTYKSSQFKCKSVDEAWNMASQVIRTYGQENAINGLSRSAAKTLDPFEQKADGRETRSQLGAACAEAG